jgi:lysyl-tRNA synthetase, class II
MQYQTVKSIVDSYLQTKEEKEVLTRGRATNIRLHKEYIFIDIHDGTKKIQLVMPKHNYENSPIKKGDSLEMSGTIRTTKSGEISIFYQNHTTLSTAKNYIGEDVELKQLLIDRNKIETIIRTTLTDHKILEVNSKLLNTHAGTSNINPYKTVGIHGDEYFLRFTMELELKKYIAKTQLPVFEIGTIFRNMGTSNRRSNEFKTAEIYLPYQTLETGIELTKEILDTISTQFNHSLEPIIIETVTELLKENNSNANTPIVNLKQEYTKIVRNIQKPLIITNHPASWVSPLTKQNSDGFALDAKFFYNEIGTIIQMCEEETNYDIIESALKSQQIELSSKRIDTSIDETFLKEISNGLPPILGIHIGLDRMLMAFTNKTNINEIIPR